jgi:F0F1-type ATP synthase assembly protein I
MNDSAWTITSRIIAGLLLYTGVGWLLSLWLGHQQVLMAVGALVGLGLSYTLVFTGLAREARKEPVSADAEREQG